MRGNAQITQKNKHFLFYPMFISTFHHT